jgi:diamine N-acetyltransferase
MIIYPTTDYNKIAILNKEVHDLHYYLYPTFFKKYSYPEMLYFFQRAMENPNSIFLLIEDNRQVLGYVWAEVNDNPANQFSDGLRSLYIHQISLIKAARNKGYGSKLMEEIYSFARRNQVKRIELDYWVENKIAKSFYKKHGFTKAREFVYKDIL